MSDDYYHRVLARDVVWMILQVGRSIRSLILSKWFTRLVISVPVLLAMLLTLNVVGSSIYSDRYAARALDRLVEDRLTEEQSIISQHFQAHQDSRTASARIRRVFGDAVSQECRKFAHQQGRSGAGAIVRRASQDEYLCELEVGGSASRRGHQIFVQVLTREHNRFQLREAYETDENGVVLGSFPHAVGSLIEIPPNYALEDSCRSRSIFDCLDFPDYPSSDLIYLPDYGSEG